jgi:hypothetical protein
MRGSLFALLLVLACACGTLENHHVITGQERARHEGQVRVLMIGEPVPNTFAEVAIVQSVGTGKQAQREPLLQALRLEARRLGCNALVRVRLDLGQSHATAVGVAGVLE